MKKDSKIYVAGHRGLVGSAIVRALQSAGYANIIERTHAELDLLDGAAVLDFFIKEKPEYVFDAAAKAGGIVANSTYPADFIYQNLAIQTNILHSAHLTKVAKLLFLGTSCIYPKLCPQPIKEEYLMTGPLEKTNEAYAIAKITGIMMCQSYRKQYGSHFISVMPTNLYGPHDNFDKETSHVFPALIAKFHEAKMKGAKTVTLWGSGTPLREFLHVDDLADACVFLMNAYDDGMPINIGTGEDLSIQELARLIQEAVGFDGEVSWDAKMPDGTPRKLLDVSRIHSLGWQHKIGLKDGIKRTYDWYKENAQ